MISDFLILYWYYVRYSIIMNFNELLVRAPWYLIRAEFLARIAS